MLSKNDIKLIRSLNHAKYRKRQSCFIAEGSKVINELLSSAMRYEKIFTLDSSKIMAEDGIYKINEKQLKQISFLKHPQDALGIFRINEPESVILELLRSNFSIVCEGIQDPGNMGTIIRIADWFGISQIICSEDTVDIYNPKVVQSTMGSLGRIKVFYTDLIDWMEKLEDEIPILVSSLKGKNIYEMDLPKNGLIVFGNESKGVSKELEKLSSHQLLVPGFGKTESLNVAVSAGIICAELRRP